MATDPKSENGGARYFLCRLIPPRPTFAADMTSEEAQVMGRHVVLDSPRRQR